jgi:glycosyltransferase involved in cell wall biosynthesis
VSSLDEVWICPPLDGPRTGGTVYNARLLGALAARAVAVKAIGLEEGRLALRAGVPGRYWIDSLFLDRVPELVRVNAAGAPIGLVVHYLATLVALGRIPRPGELSLVERTALELVRRFLVTSPFTHDVLVALGVPEAAIATAAPGVDASPGPVSSTEAGSRRSFLSALMVANLVAGKGVAPFLRALAPLSGGVPFELTLIGSLVLDAEYASECRGIVEGTPGLSPRVHFAGSMAHEAVLDRIHACELLISASRMESYGMVLAEARAAGTPILARSGGNAAAHVAANTGGELVADDAALANAVVRLARERGELRRRALLARGARTARTWSDAASDFVRQVRAPV